MGLIDRSRLLTGDVNAAIEGALEEGVDDIVVLDGHGAAFSILLEDLDSRGQLVRGRRRLELEGLDESFDLMFAVGAHSMAGTPKGILTHTLSQTGIENIWLNGQLVGEIGLWAARAGHYGVPLALVTGDSAAATEAEVLLGSVEAVAVKESASRFAAKCLPPQISRKLIREAARRPVTRAGKYHPYRPRLPVELKVEYHDCDRAEGISERKETIRIDGRTVACTGNNMLEVYATLLK
jgi:D-amino peptidase